MSRSRSGHGITDPVQIRALRLITPEQFGILVGHGETTVRRWIQIGWVTVFSALDTNTTLIRAEEVDRFLTDREQAERERREAMIRRRDQRATVAKLSGRCEHRSA